MDPQQIARNYENVLALFLSPVVFGASCLMVLSILYYPYFEKIGACIFTCMATGLVLVLSYGRALVNAYGKPPSIKNPLIVNIYATAGGLIAAFIVRLTMHGYVLKFF